jgi:hypothetical protein
MFMMRESPFYDVEFGDYSDKGTSVWTDHGKLDGVLFPQSGSNSFTPFSAPSSDFYGGRNSGLAITGIQTIGNKCKFIIRLIGPSSITWQPSSQDHCLAGRFSSESVNGGEEIFIRNNGEATLLDYNQGQWLVKSRLQSGWIGAWRLGVNDYEIAGDYDGDGLDEIYIRSSGWAGILKHQETSILRRFYSLNVDSIFILLKDYIADWSRLISILISEMNDQVSENHRELAADIDGDGRDEIIIFGPDYLGFYKLESDNKLHLQHLEEDRIGGWTLGNMDKRYIGRFTQKDYDEILLVSSEYIGVINWIEGARSFFLKSSSYDTIDVWDIKDSDEHYIGDYDGDGLDEIYIRSDNKAGIIDWSSISSRFACGWIFNDVIDPMDDRINNVEAIILTEGDRSYVGRFVREPEWVRDGILHRSGNPPYKLSVITLEGPGSGLRVRQQLTFPCESGFFGTFWSLDTHYKFILGDFHRRGKDLVISPIDHVGDNITDIFVYNPNFLTDGTPFSVSIGVNYVKPNPDRPDIHEEIGLIWIDDQYFCSKLYI